MLFLASEVKSLQEFFRLAFEYVHLLDVITDSHKLTDVFFAALRLQQDLEPFLTDHLRAPLVRDDVFR